MASNAELEGFDELMEALDQLPTTVKANALRSVNRKAARIVADEMKKNAPNETMSKSIQIKTDRNNKSGIWVGSTNFVARFFERGTVVRKTKAGYDRGQMTKQPFIERSIDNKIDEVQEFIRRNIGNDIEKFLSRLLKRQNKKLGK